METVLHYIKKYAETQPDTLAVCELKKCLTYAEYWTAIRKMANVLLQNGIKKDAHVILRCTQNIEYMVLFSALQYMQALVIPVERWQNRWRMQRNWTVRFQMQICVRCCCLQRVRPATQRVLSCIIRMMWRSLKTL